MNSSLVDLILFVAMTTATDIVQIQNENLLMTRPDGYIEGKAPTPIHPFWAQDHPTVAELQHRYLLKAQKT